MTKYYSRSKQKFVDIEQMPDQYVRNAFVKMCRHEPTEDVIFAQQQRERADNLVTQNCDLVNANNNLADRVDSLAKLYGVETDKEMEKRLSKMSKEEIKQELERS